MSNSSKVNGKWVYLYRAIDSFGDTIEFLLIRKLREAAAAKAFFKKAFRHNAIPTIVIDKSGSNTSALTNFNKNVPKKQKIRIL